MTSQLDRARSTRLVEVKAVDRIEFERALILQGYAAERAAELAHGVPSNDGALQMLARHRLAFSVALGELQQAEAEYRHAHDHFGDADLRAGHAWDRMRRSGDKARMLLQDASK